MFERVADMEINQGQQINNSEAKLNPSPRTYRVPLVLKVLFVLLSLLGILGYFSLLVKKRQAEREYTQNQGINAIDPFVENINNIHLIDVATKQRVGLLPLDKSWVLLNVWATWCPSCRSEMPSLELLHQELKDKLLVIAVSVDDKLEPILDYKKAYQLSFGILWDQEKTLPTMLQINKYPETYLINPHGRIVKQFSGAREWSSQAMTNYLLESLKKTD